VRVEPKQPIEAMSIPSDSRLFSEFGRRATHEIVDNHQPEFGEIAALAFFVWHACWFVG
jgi:hypothetical protein